jgi:hypothetical protein
VKTFIVRTSSGQHFMGNAETPEEIVLYAIARANLQAETYIVYDWNLERTVVPSPRLDGAGERHPSRRLDASR